MSRLAGVRHPNLVRHEGGFISFMGEENRWDTARKHTVIVGGVVVMETLISEPGCVDLMVSKNISFVKSNVNPASDCQC